MRDPDYLAELLAGLDAEAEEEYRDGLARHLAETVGVAPDEAGRSLLDAINRAHLAAEGEQE